MRTKQGLTRIGKLIYICVLCGCILSYLVAPSVLAQEEQQEVIRVGGFPYEGQLEKDANGNYSGYGFEYLEEISRYTGWRFEFVDGTWDECLTMLERGEIDLMGAVMKSPEREEVFEFAETPMISGYGVLATSLGNEELPYEDFQSFNGIRVGGITNNMHLTNFEEYAKEHGFVPQIQEYGDEKELRRALAAGDVDAIILTNLLRSDTLRVVATFGENDGYFATTKGNTKLSQELNKAMRRIRLENPYYNNELDQKYYDLKSSTAISFSQAELDYIRQAEAIPCVYIPDALPISYYDKETESVQGISVQVLELLEKKTGLHFTWTHPESAGDAVAMLSDGRALLIPAKYHDFNWATKNGVTLTDVYLQGQMVMVSREDATVTDAVALYDQGSQSLVAAEVVASETPIREYDSILDCMDAVLDGEAGKTFINSTIASYLGNNPKYAQLKTTPLYDISADVSMAVGGKADPLLLSVLNKGLQSISPTEINQVVLSSMKTNQGGRLATFFYLHPVQIIVIISSISIGLIFVLITLLHFRLKSSRSMRNTLYTDPLTGYPNYRAMTDDAKKLFANAKAQYALVYLDIHQFKAINDTFGYEAGDRVLKATSDSLHKFISHDERFARLYADTFALLLRYSTLEGLKTRVDELSACLQKLPVEMSNPLFNGGVYPVRDGSDQLDQACDRANYAKDSISNHFSNTFIFYDDVMREKVLAEKELERSMIPALEQEEFVPYYQPKINAITGKVVGGEALVRWKHPEKGILMPGQFLPFYEKNGFIVKIDLQIFEQVCRDMSKWLEEGKKLVPISVNFSRRNILEGNLAVRLWKIAEKYGIPPSMLEAEITETEELENLDSALEFVESLKSYGFQVSIDDYGTGYSSISFLQQQPLDTLKLDKQFMTNAMQSDKARDVMRYLVAAMHKNQIKVVCEGVETQEQRDFVVGQDCRFIQGFYYSQALARDEFETYLGLHGIEAPENKKVLPLAGFAGQGWKGAEDVLRGATPSWIVCLMTEPGYPVRYISPTFLEGLGYSELEFEEATKGSYLEWIHPRDKERVIQWFEQRENTLEEATQQYRLHKKSGEYLWIRESSKSVMTEGGQTALLCACTDIDDLVTLQEERKRLIDTIPGGVSELRLTDEGPIIQQGTAQFYEIIGHTKEQMREKGNNLVSILHPMDMESAGKQLQKILYGGAVTCTCLFRILTYDGEQRWISFKGTVFSKKDECRVTVVIFRSDEEINAKQSADIDRAKLDLALGQTEHAVFEYDIMTKKVYSHRGFAAYGIPDGVILDMEKDMVQNEFIHPKDVYKLADANRKLRDGRPHVSYEARINPSRSGADGTYMWIRVTLTTIFDQNKQPVRAVGIIEDIEKQKRFEYAFLQEAQFRKSFTNSSLMAFEVNVSQDIVQRIGGTRGFRLKEVGKTLPEPDRYTALLNAAGRFLIAEEDYERVMYELSIGHLMKLYTKGIAEREVEYRRFTDRGERLWTSMLIHLSMDQLSGDVLAYAYHRDIQERKSAEQGLEEKASRDPLTGVYNRATAERIIGTCLEKSGVSGQKQAFLMLDFNNFKVLNDTYGHLQGDSCLIEMAKKIQKHLRADDIVARVGGDEFVVFLRNIKDEENAITIAEKLAQTIKEIGTVLDMEQETSVSIGIAIAPYHGTNFESLYRNADKAMYQAKRQGDAQIVLCGMEE